MPKVEKHPSGKSIVFDPKWHTYKCPQAPGIRFTSGTKFLKQFFPEFDKEGISSRYAQKHGLHQQEVLDMWSRKGEVSRESGTLVHNYLENLALGKENAGEPHKHHDKDIMTMAESKITSADEMFRIIQEDYEILKPEMIVASLSRCVAGQVDLVGRHKETGKIAFFDYKTNAEIKFENRFQKCLGPVCHFEDCNYIQYSLQLGLYLLIAEEEGYLDEMDWDGSKVNCFIVHITPEVEGSGLYPCADVRSEILEMFGEVGEAA